MLLAAAFMAVEGDTPVARDDTTQQQAYYAALSSSRGDEFRVRTRTSGRGAKPSLSVEEGNERYEVTLVPAEGKTLSSCSTSPFSTIIELKGTAADTFRIVSTGLRGRSQTRALPK